MSTSASETAVSDAEVDILACRAGAKVGFVIHVVRRDMLRAYAAAVRQRSPPTNTKGRNSVNSPEMGLHLNRYTLCST